MSEPSFYSSPTRNEANNFPRIIPASENALIVYFSEAPSKQISAKISAVQQQILALAGDALLDLVPSFTSLLVIYNTLSTDHLAITRLIKQAWDETGAAVAEIAGKVITLPVYYHEGSGPDLMDLAQKAGLSVEEVIKLHSQPVYQVYSIGFAPGFAYLGEVDPIIATPRLKTPRKHVPKGAVAIADRQTAVYPSESPGGWNLIGLCPLPLFDLTQSPAMPFEVGDSVKFEVIPKSEFLKLGGTL